MPAAFRRAFPIVSRLLPVAAGAFTASAWGALHPSALSLGRAEALPFLREGLLPFAEFRRLARRALRQALPVQHYQFLPNEQEVPPK